MFSPIGVTVSHIADYFIDPGDSTCVQGFPYTEAVLGIVPSYLGFLKRLSYTGSLIIVR